MIQFKSFNIFITEEKETCIIRFARMSCLKGSGGDAID